MGVDDRNMRQPRGLDGVGCLVVSLNPFRYVNETGVVVLYVFFLTLEFLV
jgi:hypothetical protein